MGLDLLTFGEALVEVMRPGIDQPLDRPGSFIGPYPSGAPFIFAVQAARLGAEVGVIGAVGDDAFGKCMIDQLRDDGVDLRGVHRLKNYSTGVAFVSYNADGSRDFVFHARHAAAGQLSPEMLNAGLFEGLKCLHVTGSSLSLNDEALQLGLKALEMARAAGAKISFDPNIRPQLMPVERAKEVFQPFLQAAHIIMPTIDEAMALTGQPSGYSAVKSLLNETEGRLVVTTRGEKGSHISTFSPEITHNRHIAGFSVTEVDPTGAGDCFDAGFLTRWLAGDSAEDAALFANACGALAVTVQGPMAGAKTTAEIQKFMRETKRNNRPGKGDDDDD